MQYSPGTYLDWLVLCPILFMSDTEDRVSGLQVACASRKRDKILIFDISYVCDKPTEVSSATFLTFFLDC